LQIAKDKQKDLANISYNIEWRYND
jgi:hypothetical protein